MFGERTDEIALRLDECAEGADALIVQGGINDIAQGRPAGGPPRTCERMVAEGRRLGLDVYLTTVLPWNNGYPVARDPISELNRLIEGIGEREGVPVIDFYDALDDPEAPGRMPAKLTIDGDHPSVLGYERLGQVVAAELGSG